MRPAKSFKLEQGIRTVWPTQQKRKSGGVLERPRNWGWGNINGQGCVWTRKQRCDDSRPQSLGR